MPRYQFLNIETFHLIIADTKDAARQLALNEAAIVDATRDADFGSPSKIVVLDRVYEVLPLLSQPSRRRRHREFAASCGKASG